MPDEVLVSILSLITMKEAGRTSVLSRRWRKLWTFVPNLNFDAPGRSYYLQERACLLFTDRTNYLNCVNSVLELHQAPAIDQFRICFDLDEIYRHDIDNWVNFALKKRVQRLELCLEGLGDFNRYHFPSMCNSIRCLRSRSLGFPSCNSLRALDLKSVNISGEVLEYFLHECPFLERLKVVRSRTLVNLKVAGPLHQLKYLEIYHCFKLQNLEISATNLVSFVYCGPRITMPLKHVPNLVEASIGGLYCEYLIHKFCEFSSYFLQLRTLILELGLIYERMEFLEFPILINLKELELTALASGSASLLDFSSLISAAPVLYRFALKLNWSKPVRRKVQKFPKCPHHGLKLVELVGFVGKIIDMEFAMYLIENAVALEKIIIDPRNPQMIGSVWEYHNMKEIEAARKRAKKLETKLSLGSKLVIL
ncbi:hypothetical protein SLA2020_365060 [Shorea laevis]